MPSPEKKDRAGLGKVMDGIFRERRGERGELIGLLQEVQAKLGYLPAEAMLEIARFTKVPESQVFGAASFYAQFRFTPVGRNMVMACRGTACHVRGGPRILQELEDCLGVKAGGTTGDSEYSLETVACIGCCSLAPCVMVNKEVHANLTPKKVREMLGGRGGK